MSKPLKPLVYGRDERPVPVEADVAHMEMILAAHGYKASREDLVAFWQDHSERSCHGWLPLGEDDDVLNVLMRGLYEPEHVLAD